MKKMLKILVPSMLGSGLTIAVFLLAGINHKNSPVFLSRQDPVPIHKTEYTVKENGEIIPLDFTGVSKDAMNSVVHIKSTRNIHSRNQSLIIFPLLSNLMSMVLFSASLSQPSFSGFKKAVSE